MTSRTEARLGAAARNTLKEAEKMERFSDSDSSVDLDFEVEGDNDLLETSQGLMPYRFEPDLDEKEPDNSSDTDSPDDEPNGAEPERAVVQEPGRLDNTDW